jgi:uncharacterized protein involved in exopolysaccharide biosynthesis
MAVLSGPARLPLLSDYPRFARRHRAPIALLACLGLLIGVVLSVTRPVTYSATASLALTPVPKYLAPLSTEIAPPEVTIDTDAQLLRSPAVQTAVAQALGTDADTAGKHVTVSATAVSNVLHVTVTAHSAQKAASAANAAANALIDVRRQDLGSLQGAQLRQLDYLIRNQETLLALEQTRSVIIPSTDNDVFAELANLKASLREVAAARNTPAVVIDPAVPPLHHDYPNTQVPIVSGGMLGFLAGVLIGIARDRRRRVRHHLTAPRLTNPFDVQPDAVTRHEDLHYV